MDGDDTCPNQLQSQFVERKFQCVCYRVTVGSYM